MRETLPHYRNTKIRSDERTSKNIMKSTPVSLSNIRIRRLIEHTFFVLKKHGFQPYGLPDGSTRFQRPNSELATKMEVSDERVLIRPDCEGPIMIGGTFVEYLLRSGLFTLDFDEGQCVIASIDPE